MRYITDYPVQMALEKGGWLKVGHLVHIDDWPYLVVAQRSETEFEVARVKRIVE